MDGRNSILRGAALIGAPVVLSLILAVESSAWAQIRPPYPETPGARAPRVSGRPAPRDEGRFAPPSGAQDAAGLIEDGGLVIDDFNGPLRTEFDDLDSDPDLTAEERVNIRVYETANRGVVNITTKATRETMLFLEVPQSGSGSGSVIDRNGHILTNWHVIEGAQQIKVNLFNGDSHDAEVVGSDPANDIAVLRINAEPDVLYPLEPGESARLRVGQHIFAIGNPFGLERTLTRGIISSLNRSLPSKTGRTMRSIIQVDAALNRGNSGGPLLNSKGRLIGMNTAIASSTGENTGVGFAIPVNTIKRVVPQLIRDGKVVRPSIGITHIYPTDEGLVIVAMTPDGPAERAGLKGFRLVKQTKRRGPFSFAETVVDRSQADRIVGVAGKPIKSKDELLDAIEERRPGDELTLVVDRQGQRFNVKLTLAVEE